MKGGFLNDDCSKVVVQAIHHYVVAKYLVIGSLRRQRQRYRSFHLAGCGGCSVPGGGGAASPTRPNTLIFILCDDAIGSDIDRLPRFSR